MNLSPHVVLALALPIVATACGTEPDVNSGGGIAGSAQAAGGSSSGGSQAGTAGTGTGAAAGSTTTGKGGASGATGTGGGTSKGGASAGTGGASGTSAAGTGGSVAVGGTTAKGGAGGGSAGSGTAGKGTAGSGTAGSGTAGSGSLAICQGVASATFMPPSVCDGPSGNTSKEVPSNHVYSTSWFGCYAKPDGTIVKDPTDNCQFACGPKGYCPAGQSGPDCEATLKWFSADADRYGCGARIRLTNCVNGKQVVVTSLDRGPNCGNEQSFGVPVIDMSHDAMIYLFDGKEYGGSDKKRIVVEPVDMTTPLGPV